MYCCKEICYMCTFVLPKDIRNKEVCRAMCTTLCDMIYQFPSFVFTSIVLGMEPAPHLSVYVEFFFGFFFLWFTKLTSHF